MSRNESAQREDCSEQCDVPVKGHGNRHTDHERREHKAQEKGPLEPAENSRNLLEEAGFVDFLGSSTPGHVDAEHVAEQCLTHVQRDTSQEDKEDWDPLEVLEEGFEETGLAYAVSEHCERDVAHGGKDDDDGEIYLEGIEIVVVEHAVEPADQEEIQHREYPSRAEGVVSTHIGHDGELGGERNAGNEEFAEELGEGSTTRPFEERVKDEFAASICISR